MSVEKGFPFHTVSDHLMKTGSLHIGYLLDPGGPPGLQVHLLLPSRNTVPSESRMVAFLAILAGAADMALLILSALLISSAMAFGASTKANRATITRFIRPPSFRISTATRTLARPSAFQLRLKVVHEFTHLSARAEFDRLVILVDPYRVSRGPVVDFAGRHCFFGAVGIGHVD